MNWNTAYQLFTLALLSGLAGGVFKLIVWAIRLEPRISRLEESFNRIEGWINIQWDGTTERRIHAKGKGD